MIYYSNNLSNSQARHSVFKRTITIVTTLELKQCLQAREAYKTNPY